MAHKPHESLYENILINYRWVFVCLFLLPMSVFFDLWMYFRNYVVFKLSSAPCEHGNKVKFVQKQVFDWIKNGKKQRMCTARPGWQTMSFRQPIYKNTLYKVQVNLVDILDVNLKKPSVLVEPLVTMGQLTATLNPLGWTIPVLPELDDLTVGGLVMGTGIESSSHIYGLFQDICISFELVLCDGSIIKCSEESNPDIFYSVPWSYGTLGILTAVEIKLIPVKKFIKLTYEPIFSIEELEKKFEAASQNELNEFVEVLAFSKEESVLMTGIISDKPPRRNKINSIGRWYKPWFFTHVAKVLARKKNLTEYIPLRDYYHRHTRALFWELQDIISFGNHPIFRYLFGWLVPPKVSLLKLTQSKATKRLYENNHIIQDMLIPISSLGKCLEFFDKIVKVYPIWLCPFKLFNKPGMVHPARDNAQMYVDVGIYGVPKVDNFKPVETTREIEQFVREEQGFQMLYADTYLTKEEFRQMFDHSLYDKVRQELDCASAFPEVYDKVCKSARI